MTSSWISYWRARCFVCCSERMFWSVSDSSWPLTPAPVHHPHCTEPFSALTSQAVLGQALRHGSSHACASQLSFSWSPNRRRFMRNAFRFWLGLLAPSASNLTLIAWTRNKSTNPESIPCIATMLVLNEKPGLGHNECTTNASSSSTHSQIQILDFSETLFVSSFSCQNIRLQSKRGT